MDIRPIKTEDDYERTLARIDALMDAVPDTPEGDELDILVTLVEVYEDRMFPMEGLSPIDAIKARMDDLDMTRKDLEPIIGPRGRVSEILSGRRTLSVAMMRRVRDEMGIPADVLLSD